MPKLGRNELQELLIQAEDSFPHGACNTCKCFLGYLAQLRIDSDSTDKDLFLPYKVDRKDMHHCLGCDPCPPGDLYAEYMKKNRILQDNHQWQQTPRRRSQPRNQLIIPRVAPPRRETILSRKEFC